MRVCRQFLLWLIVVVGLMVPPMMRAGLTGDNVAVIVNAADFESMEVANAYVRLRDIPPGNVIYLSGIDDSHTIPLQVFRARILRPILHTLDSRRLRPQIHCIVYASGFPTRIDCASELDPAKYPQVENPITSITGLTYLYQQALSEGAAFVLPYTNFYAQTAFSPALHDHGWSDEEQRLYRETLQLLLRRQSDDPPSVDALRAAAAKLTPLAAAHPANVELQYNHACLLALTGSAESAIAALNLAIDAGWHDHARTLRDADLQSLHESDAFQACIARMKAATLQIPSRGFSATAGWNAQGQPVPARAENGHTPPRYLLTTMLGAGFQHGIDTTDTIDYLTMARTADYTAPKGTIYFTQTKDVRSRTRAGAFASAVAQIQAEGVAAKIHNGVFPDGANDIAGVCAGFAKHALRGKGTRLLPGAIVDNLTSWGGVLHESGQTKLTRYLKMGAAGASGAVSEPYAIQTKFAEPYLFVHYVRGATLAEAYYQSIRSPYNLLIMGDPLCAPWAKPPTLTLADPIPQNPTGPFNLHPLTASPVLAYEIFVDGLRIAIVLPGYAYQLDPTKFSDGYHRIAVTAIADTPLQSRSSIHASTTFRSHELSLDTTIDNRTTFLGGFFEIQATTNHPDARIAVLHNGRTIAVAQGPKATIQIPAAHLGRGQSELLVAAILNKQVTQSPPITIIVK